MKKVLVGGVFDILHYGHIQFLKKAKALGDYLIIALESDANVKKLKGISRPIHNQKQRKEILESLSFVNEVLILKDEMHDQDYRELVKRVRPFAIAVTKGDPILEKKKTHGKLVGAEVVEIEKIDVPSTTRIAKLLRLE